MKNENLNLKLDWVVARLVGGKLSMIIPCEVQSADITQNYHANWEAYAQELEEIPNSKHGMNWANIWKRMIPQLILKGSIAATSKLCMAGHYFVVLDHVYRRFENLLGSATTVNSPGEGILTVSTYGLGPQVPHGSIRKLEIQRTIRMETSEFAMAFASAGERNPLGPQLESKVLETLNAL